MSRALLVSVRWGEDVLAVRRLSGSGEATFGSDPGAIAPIPAGALGAESLRFAELCDGVAKIQVPDGAVLVRHSALGTVSAETGPRAIALEANEVCVLQRGPFGIVAAAIESDDPPMRAPVWGRIRGGALMHVTAAAVVHAALFLVAGHAAHAAEAREAERTEALRSMLVSAERRTSADAPVRGDGSDFGEGRQENAEAGDGEAGGGERAAAEEGAIGSALSRERAPRRYTVKARPATSPSAGKKAPAESFESAMIGLLNAQPEGSSPFAPFTPSGRGDATADGAMWARSIGESAGASGLGLHGVGIGGGGKGAGIGVGKIGSLGHADGPEGLGTGGEGSPLFRARLNGWQKQYRPYRCGYGCSVSGRLPPEAVQRIVRANMPRMRGCYETGLRKNPSLSGRVATRFVIARDGLVSEVSSEGSDLPDARVVACISRAFSSLAFPQPDGGVVTVVYPIVFTSEAEPGTMRFE